MTDAKAACSPTLTINKQDFQENVLTVTITGIELGDGSTTCVTCCIPTKARTVTVDRIGYIGWWTLPPGKLMWEFASWEPVDDSLSFSSVGSDAEGWVYQRKKVQNFHELIFELPLADGGELLAVQVSAEMAKAVAPVGNDWF